MSPLRHAALSLLLVLAACRTQMPSSTLPDGGADPLSRFDVSNWQNTLDAGTLYFLTELKKAQRGESADLDGDGVRELSVFHTPDDTTHWVWQPEYFESFELEKAADGTVTRRIAYENYAYWVEVDVFGPDAGAALFQFDDNADNHFDRRITRSVQDDGGYLWVEEDTDAGPRGVFAETNRWVTHPWADQMGSGDDGCNGTSNMPFEFGFLAENVPGITSLDTGAAGCNLMQKARLGRAVDCMREKLNCLDRTNPAVRNRLVSRLASDEWQLGCNNPCPGRDATTNARVGDIAAQTNFSKDVLDHASDDELCALVIHEGLHMAESPYNPKDHDHNGNDEIYACAHYCGGCTSRGPASPKPTPNQDCATCAGNNDAKRRACGVKKDFTSVGPAYSVCTGGLGTLMTPCPDWHAPVEQDCNGKQIGQPNLPAGCCNMCPSSAPTNSKPCGTPPPPSDTCSMKAPECPP